MVYIAHRGLIDGPNKTLENNPDHITKVLDMGYDAEIDLRVIDSKLFLGHDTPDYLIDASFLKKTGLWIHAKNLEALYWLNHTNYNYFWHQNDDFTLTSHNWIWAYPGKELTPNSIMVMPEWNKTVEELTNLKENCFGICSDYVSVMNSKNEYL
jgi:hypothetical protein